MEENNVEVKQKKGTGLIIVIVVLIIAVLGLTSYVCYDKLIANKDDPKEKNTEKKDNKKETKEYKIGDKVKIAVNDSTEVEFYVLKDSSKTEDSVTLFAEKNIGYSAFNNDFTDGNEYKGSLIENKLNELTSTWTNIKEKRLITVDEIKTTGLTNKVQCGPSENDICDKIENNSWLKYNNEIYWTMTKAENNGNIKYDEGKYVYYISLDGTITGHIVGYKPGSEWNKNGNYFDSFGIRPVIEVSKEYIK